MSVLSSSQSLLCDRPPAPTLTALLVCLPPSLCQCGSQTTDVQTWMAFSGLNSVMTFCFVDTVVTGGMKTGLGIVAIDYRAYL